jgi:hypothetical protein
MSESTFVLSCWRVATTMAILFVVGGRRIDAQCEPLEPASLKSTSLDLDEKCCNVDAGAESDGSGHRRTQGTGCVLGTCTTARAARGV